MYVISISHKTAPVDIRELVSFSAEDQETFLNQVMSSDHINECVLVSTCNRSEVYFNGDSQAIQAMQKQLADFKKIDLELLLKHFLIYMEEKAVRHLFQVTCGMDSMVLGEDEILGQVKDAYERALNLGTTQYQLNTLFQAAITCAKKVKTDTKLSKTPVSIGTLTANEVFHFPEEHKTVLIIGLTGKMGSIIMKNLYDKPNIEMIGTSRSHNSMEAIGRDYKNVKMIEYKERYEYMDLADIVISATTSPHYTITCHELAEKIHKNKERLFIDLAVPMDIDKEITKIERTTIHDIDYFNQTSLQNHKLKEQESEQAQQIIEEQLDTVKKELVFHEFLPDISQVGQIIKDHSLENILYQIRKKANSEELKVFLDLLQRLNQ